MLNPEVPKQNRLERSKDYKRPTEYPQFGVQQIDVQPGEEAEGGNPLGSEFRFGSEDEARSFIDEQRSMGFSGVVSLRKWEKSGSSEYSDLIERI